MKTNQMMQEVSIAQLATLILEARRIGREKTDYPYTKADVARGAGGAAVAGGVYVAGTRHSFNKAKSVAKAKLFKQYRSDKIVNKLWAKMLKEPQWKKLSHQAGKGMIKPAAIIAGIAGIALMVRNKNRRLIAAKKAEKKNKPAE